MKRAARLEQVATLRAQEREPVIRIPAGEKPHSFQVEAAGLDTETTARVYVHPGAFIAGLHAIGYNKTPEELGIVIEDQYGTEIPCGIVPLGNSYVGGLVLNAKTAICFETDYSLKGGAAGSDNTAPLTIVITDPQDTLLYLEQWYCTGVAIVGKPCTEDDNKLVLTDVTHATNHAERMYYPIAVVTTGEDGVTSIRQILRSDFREPLSGSLRGRVV